MRRGFLLVKDHMKAEPGDVIFTAHKGAVDRLIRVTTTNMVSHVGAILAVEKLDGGGVEWETLEAFPPRVKVRRRRSSDRFFLDEVVSDGNRHVGIVSVFRPVNLGMDPVWGDAELEWLRRFDGARYDYLAVVRLGLTRMCRSRLLSLVARPLMLMFPWENHPRWWMCSELKSKWFRFLGYEGLPDEDYAVPPGDLERYCFNRLVGVID